MESDMFASIRKLLIEKGLTQDRADNFVSQLRHQKLSSKEIIFTEGDLNPPVVFVKSGMVRLFVTDEDGGISTRLISGPGTFAGCVHSVFYKSHSRYTCETIGSSEVIIIADSLIQEALSRDSSRLLMQNIVIEKLLHMMHEKALMLPLKATERYLFFRERYPKIVDKVPSGIIANYIGVRPQSLSRIKNSLK